MKHMILALVRTENDLFRLNFPEYPMAPAYGATIEEAVTTGAIALASSLHSTAADGHDITNPLNLSDAYKRNEGAIKDGAMAIGVEIDFPGKATRINITVEEGLLGRIDRAAKTEGKSRSAFLAAAAFDRLSAH